MSEQEDRAGRAVAVVGIVVTAVVALGVGWVVAALFGEPPSDRWGRAFGVAGSVTLAAVVMPWIRRWQSGRETSRGRFLCGLRVVEGTVPGLGARWTMGRASLVSGRVDFDRGRFAVRWGSRPGISFAVSRRSDPRDATSRESLRVGADARVVDLVTTAGARVRMAAILPASLAPALAALDD